MTFLNVIAFQKSAVAQWKRAGLITLMSLDRNQAALVLFYFFFPFGLLVSRSNVMFFFFARNVSYLRLGFIPQSSVASRSTTTRDRKSKYPSSPYKK